MKKYLFAAIAIAVLATSCNTYIGVHQKESKVLLTGQTGFIFYKSWIKECDKSDGANGPRLVCTKVEVTDKGAEKAAEKK